ncbi:MAG: hypothetical protein KBE86_04900 [Chitinophagales bacterium]|nr:hypothetical protein [Chitinophagales bacterium]
MHGNKAENLKRLVKVNYNVPAFLAFDISETDKIFDTIINAHPNIKYWAVRSSSAEEDGVISSAAGKYHSEIGVPTHHLQLAIQRVIASMPNQNHSGIIVQEFIPGEVSGVFFSLGKGILINANTGLCDTVVNGAACDQYWINMNGDILRKHITSKKSAHIWNGNTIENKTIIHESLNKKHIQQLIEISKKLKLDFSFDADVEWTFKNDTLYILQIRPITVSVPFPDSEIIYYDSSNISESYNGIVLPLTYTYVKQLYAYVYFDLLKYSGVSKVKLKKHQSEIFNNMIACFYGRMYYNMNNWHRMMQFLPAYKKNKVNLERMITAKTKAEIHTAEKIAPTKFFTIKYTILVFFKILFFPITLWQFTKATNKILNQSINILKKKQTNASCLQYLEKLETGILRKWYITVENDTILMTILGKQSKTTNPQRINEVLQSKTKSGDQLIALHLLAKDILNNSVLTSHLEQNDIIGFKFSLNTLPSLQQMWSDYILQFGGRFANELKLESPGIDEHAEQLLNTLKLMASFNPNKQEEKKTHLQLTFSEKMLKKFVARREELRMFRSNMLGIVRKIFLNIAENLVAENKLNAVEDIFYLEYEEVKLLCNNTGQFDAYKKIIASRIHQYKTYENITPEVHFAIEKNTEAPVRNTTTRNINNNQLTGIPVFGGKVSGKAGVFKKYDIQRKITFEILVASHTDPGWAPLIANSKGLIIEYGGVLSHASIIARELKIPAIIGVENATDFIQDGMHVHLFADEGKIEF